jgi:hypothetical protein
MAAIEATSRVKIRFIGLLFLPHTFCLGSCMTPIFGTVDFGILNYLTEIEHRSGEMFHMSKRDAQFIDILKFQFVCFAWRLGIF